VEGAQQLIGLPHRRQALLAGLASLAVPGTALSQNDALPLRLNGRLIQGGAAIGQTAPGATIFIDGEEVGQASPEGWFVVGFDRDAASKLEVRVMSQGVQAAQVLPIQSGDFDIQRINGLPQNQVTPTAPELLARIRQEAARKRAGFASRADRIDFRQGFILPLDDFRLSGRFGGQRILNGVSARPHYGVDMAAPVGTPVMAPAGAEVAFAETGLHYEGGLIMLDHGQGLVSAYLHLSQVHVRQGQSVAQGEVIAAVGAEGRATGPHLCWRMKWRDRNLNPLSLVGFRAA
jgi:murein DD-endopeptidase MepM/ murein hydrolase activator NlpD